MRVAVVVALAGIIVLGLLSRSGYTAVERKAENHLLLEERRSWPVPGPSSIAGVAILQTKADEGSAIILDRVAGAVFAVNLANAVVERHFLPPSPAGYPYSYMAVSDGSAYLLDSTGECLALHFGKLLSSNPCGKHVAGGAVLLALYSEKGKVIGAASSGSTLKLIELELTGLGSPAPSDATIDIDDVVPRIVGLTDRVLVLERPTEIYTWSRDDKGSVQLSLSWRDATFQRFVGMARLEGGVLVGLQKRLSTGSHLVFVADDGHATLPRELPFRIRSLSSSTPMTLLMVRDINGLELALYDVIPHRN